MRVDLEVNMGETHRQSGVRGRRHRLLVAMLCALSLVCLISAARASAASAGEFAITHFDGEVTSQNGAAYTQAGGHPYQASTTIEFANSLADNGSTFPDADAKDMNVALPPGFVINPNATPRCDEEELEVVGVFNVLEHQTCPPETQVGVVKLDVGYIFGEMTVPVFNIVPPPGRPAEFAFNVLGEAMVHLFPKVRSESDYGITAEIVNASQSDPFYVTSLTLWGVPADPSHDAQRGQICIFGAACFQGGVSVASPPKALLSNPTACEGPLTTSVTADSWPDPGAFVEASFLSHDDSTPPQPVGISGCERLAFAPTMTVMPTTSAARASTGLNLDIHVPQEGLENPSGLRTADLKSAVLALPEGMTINPSSANGLSGCTAGQIGLLGTDLPAPSPIRFTNAPASCPRSSSIGSVEIDTPLLQAPLKGSLYLAQQDANPFHSLLALYLVAEGEGVRVKLAGHVEAAEGTGRLTVRFDDSPQLPFEDLRVSIFGGEGAPLLTPSKCGTYATNATLGSWGGQTANLADSFAISEGCSVGSSFSPAFQAGTTSNQAASFSPFVVNISRADPEAWLGGVTVKAPPGLIGVIKNVAKCPEPQAADGDCEAASLIGDTTVAAGVGPDPYHLQGQVFLTGPYKGAPFGLSIVVPALAGPFDLGTVVVRAAVDVDPHTAQVTITSDPLPTMLQGIPLDLREVEMSIDRAAFMFNPTSCAHMSITGSVSSGEGDTAAVSSGFQAAGCAALAFDPKLTASTSARTSRRYGASLHVKLTYPDRDIDGKAFSAAGPQSSGEAAQANIRSVKVSLPAALPSRTETLKLACAEQVFARDPASCPAASEVGIAVAHTPILSAPLRGPAYLVSHGGAAFPDLDLVLQGEGMTIDLVGNTNIVKGITSSTFATAPDAPIESFELTLPEGAHSALAANTDLCAHRLTMPTTLTGQNGARIEASTPVEVSGCSSQLGVHAGVVHGRTLRLSAYVPARGRLTVSGRGIARTIKQVQGRETIRLIVKATTPGSFSTTLRISFARGKGRTQTRSLRVKFG